MKLRAPAIPLITIDPYFSVWSTEEINDKFPYHWTGSRNSILGIVEIDGTEYRFLGSGIRDGKVCEEKLNVVSIDIDALTTKIIYSNDVIKLTAEFTSPLIASDLYLCSRPVSYLKLSYESLDGKAHRVFAKISCSEELVLNKAGQSRVWSEQGKGKEVSYVKMGNGTQNVLSDCGDDIRIDWGYLYLAAKGDAEFGNEVYENLYSVWAKAELDSEKLFLFAYDDIKSILYYNKPLDAYWHKNCNGIIDAIDEAAAEYALLKSRCDDFANDLYQTATQKGNVQYAELLALAYRQVMAAHKLVVDDQGDLLYVSKECFSNGCAVTVDVTYPSAPMFLYYNTALIRAMIEPIFRYANSEEWQFDFAPHDLGRYPFVNGQVYFPNDITGQMPVEECGNMIILTAALCIAENDFALAQRNFDLLQKWSKYLVMFGEDPENQLCTDDFAGKLAHNCNLSIKAIMGIVAFSKILEALSKKDEAQEYMSIAKKYVKSFLQRALNKDGSYRLAYDKENSFSLKYNAIWDKLWNTNLFPESFFEAELNRYKKEAKSFGTPLDNRCDWSKTDWLLWVACFDENGDDFDFIVNKMWNFFNETQKRVPMGDWIDVATGATEMFQNRTVQGGLFIKLLL